MGKIGLLVGLSGVVAAVAAVADATVKIDEVKVADPWTTGVYPFLDRQNASHPDE